MSAPPQEVKSALEEMRDKGMKRVGKTSISKDSSGSYRVVPDKEAIEGMGRPEQAVQWVDQARGVVILQFPEVGDD